MFSSSSDALTTSTTNSTVSSPANRREESNLEKFANVILRTAELDTSAASLICETDTAVGVTRPAIHQESSSSDVISKTSTPFSQDQRTSPRDGVVKEAFQLKYSDIPTKTESNLVANSSSLHRQTESECDQPAALPRLTKSLWRVSIPKEWKDAPETLAKPPNRKRKALHQSQDSCATSATCSQIVTKSNTVTPTFTNVSISSGQASVSKVFPSSLTVTSSSKRKTVQLSQSVSKIDTACNLPLMQGNTVNSTSAAKSVEHVPMISPKVKVLECKDMPVTLTKIPDQNIKSSLPTSSAARNCQPVLQSSKANSSNFSKLLWQVGMPSDLSMTNMNAAMSENIIPVMQSDEQKSDVTNLNTRVMKVCRYCSQGDYEGKKYVNLFGTKARKEKLVEALEQYGELSPMRCERFQPTRLCPKCYGLIRSIQSKVNELKKRLGKSEAQLPGCGKVGEKRSLVETCRPPVLDVIPSPKKSRLLIVDGGDGINSGTNLTVYTIPRRSGVDCASQSSAPQDPGLVITSVMSLRPGGFKQILPQPVPSTLIIENSSATAVPTFAKSETVSMAVPVKVIPMPVGTAPVASNAQIPLSMKTSVPPATTPIVIPVPGSIALTSKPNQSTPVNIAPGPITVTNLRSTSSAAKASDLKIYTSTPLSTNGSAKGVRPVTLLRPAPTRLHNSAHPISNTTTSKSVTQMSPSIPGSVLVTKTADPIVQSIPLVSTGLVSAAPILNLSAIVTNDSRPASTSLLDAKSVSIPSAPVTQVARQVSTPFLNSVPVSTSSAPVTHSVTHPAITSLLNSPPVSTSAPVSRDITQTPSLLNSALVSVSTTSVTHDISRTTSLLNSEQVSDSTAPVTHGGTHQATTSLLNSAPISLSSAAVTCGITQAAPSLLNSAQVQNTSSVPVSHNVTPVSISSPTFIDMLGSKPVMQQTTTISSSKMPLSSLHVACPIHVHVPSSVPVTKPGATTVFESAQQGLTTVTSLTPAATPANIQPVVSGAVNTCLTEPAAQPVEISGGLVSGTALCHSSTSAAASERTQGATCNPVSKVVCQLNTTLSVATIESQTEMIAHSSSAVPTSAPVKASLLIPLGSQSSPLTLQCKLPENSKGKLLVPITIDVNQFLAQIELDETKPFQVNTVSDPMPLDFSDTELTEALSDALLEPLPAEISLGDDALLPTQTESVSQAAEELKSKPSSLSEPSTKAIPGPGPKPEPKPRSKQEPKARAKPEPKPRTKAAEILVASGLRNPKLIDMLKKPVSLDDLRKIIISMQWGLSEDIAAQFMKIESLRYSLMYLLLKEIDEQCQSLCTRKYHASKLHSMFYKREEKLMWFDWNAVVDELKEQAPDLLDVLATVAAPKVNQGMNHQAVAMTFACSILMNKRWIELSRVQNLLMDAISSVGFLPKRSPLFESFCAMGLCNNMYHKDEYRHEKNFEKRLIADGKAYFNFKDKDHNKVKVEDQGKGQCYSQGKAHILDHNYTRETGQSQGRVNGKTKGQFLGQSSGQLQDHHKSQLCSQDKHQQQMENKVHLHGHGQSSVKEKGQLQGQEKGQLQGQEKGQLQGQDRGQLQDQDKGQFQGQDKGPFLGQDKYQLQGQEKGQLQDQDKGQFQGQDKDQLQGQEKCQLQGQDKGQLLGQDRVQLQEKGQLQGEGRGQLQDQDKDQFQGQYEGQLQGQEKGQFQCLEGHGQNQSQLQGKEKVQLEDQDKDQLQGQENGQVGVQAQF